MDHPGQKKALVGQAVACLSGGLDSTVAMAMAISAGWQVVRAITFDYGQRAAEREKIASTQIAAHYQVPHQIIDLPWFGSMARAGSLLQKNKKVTFIAQPFRHSFFKGEISCIVMNGDCLFGIKRHPGLFGAKLTPEYIKLIDLPLSIKKEVSALSKFFLKKFGSLPTICRVDFLGIDAYYEILEVELIDPDLFFRNIPEDIRKKAISTIIKSINIYV